MSIEEKQSSFERSIVHACLVFLAVVLPALSPIDYAKAKDNTVDHSTKQHLNNIEEFNKQDATEGEGETISPIQKFFDDKVSLTGPTIELNYEYLDVKDVGDKTSDSSSDFFMSTAELALRIFFNEWSKAKIVIEAVDVGKKGDDTEIRPDEAIVTLKTLQIPLYAVGGKTVLPFGSFENHLIESTLPEDIYEIDEWGATLGFNPDFYGLDISFSIYRYSQITYNLEDFNTHEFSPERPEEDTFKSIIANITLEPIEDTLTLSTFYNSEPGDGRHNQSIGAALTLNYGKFILDAEYITALQREKGENEEENKESVGVVGLAFNMLDSLQLATRYEFFNDDTHGGQDEVRDCHIVAGFNYSILDNLPYLNDATLSFEYRYSKFEKEKNSDAADSQNMIQVQLELGF